MVPTEDVVQALMEYLVEPLLPIKSSSSPHDQPSIAKQMHAAVLLYNYYHRKQFPKLEYLDMMSFCKVAVNAKPKLLVYLKDTKEINPSGEIEALSITEKAIMDACNISLQLHKLTDAPSMEGSPVSKIAVLLTDSKMENCALVYSGTTKGVWSLIEREDDGSDQCSSWPVKATNGDETLLQKLAMSAVKDTTGINPSELTVLESHVTYSLSEEKTTARFFIMKCQSVIPETFRVPMKDAIDSLQGPLVIKSCNSYTVSDIVGYFHLLPYAAIITEWFSRDMLAKDGNSNNDQLRTVATSERRNGSSDTCQDGKFPVLKTVKTEISDQKKVGDPHIDRHETIGKEVKTSNLSCNKELKTYSRVSADNAVTKLSKEDTDMADAVTSSLVDASTLHSNAVTKQEVPILSGDNFLDCVDPSCPRGDQQVAGSSIGVKRKLADADDLLGHERKQRCPDDDSEIDLNNGSDMSASEHMMNASGENAIVCVAEMNDDRRLLISGSTPEDVVYVGHVCFPEKYMALYERIVAKFGDIIIPESKQALLCSDMVSLTMKGLLDVVECISQAATPAIDAVTLESWELKIRFCEVAGLKVEWLRGHLEKLKQVNENAHVGELKSRVVSLEQSLEARRKRAAELRDELEMVLAEEKSLAEEKKAADANLEEALRQDRLALCLV